MQRGGVRGMMMCELLITMFDLSDIWQIENDVKLVLDRAWKLKSDNVSFKRVAGKVRREWDDG